jgi:uncharacterized membrane protein YqjE
MTHESKGLLDSLSNLASTLVSIIHTRLALLSTDIEEDRERLFSQIILSIIAAFCLIIGFVLMIILIVFVLWEEHRLYALFSIAGILILTGFLIGGFAIYKLKTKPKFFSASLAELLKDKEKLNSR